MNQRITWIDYSKSLAILFVILIHVHASYTVSKMLSAMIMPFFFLLSGYLFDYDRNPCFGPFARKRVRQILIPYFWINIVAWVAWVAVLRHFGDDSTAGVEWHQPLTAVFTGNAPMMVHDVPMWALLSFFIVEIVFYPLGKTLRSTCLTAIVALSLSVVLYCLFPDKMKSWPLVIGPSIAALSFYAMGHAYRLVDRDERLSKRVFSLPATIVYIVVFALSAHYNGYVSFRLCRYWSYPLFFISSLTGSLASISLMRWLAAAIGSNRVVRLISDTTLIICGFHLLVFSAIKGAAYMGLHIDPAKITHGWHGILFAVVAFAITVFPVAWFVRRYLRLLVGK